MLGERRPRPQTAPTPSPFPSQDTGAAAAVMATLYPSLEDMKGHQVLQVGVRSTSLWGGEGLTPRGSPRAPPFSRQAQAAAGVGTPATTVLTEKPKLPSGNVGCDQPPVSRGCLGWGVAHHGRGGSVGTPPQLGTGVGDGAWGFLPPGSSRGGSLHVPCASCWLLVLGGSRMCVWGGCKLGTPPTKAIPRCAPQHRPCCTPTWRSWRTTWDSRSPAKRSRKNSSRTAAP